MGRKILLIKKGLTAFLHCVSVSVSLMPVHGQICLAGQTRAEFSTLDVGILVYAMHLYSLQKQLGQLLGYLPLAFALPGL